MKPKLSKISPLAGAKRVFGKQAAANFAKGIFKVAALGAVMTAILWPERHRLDAMVRFDPAAILGVTTTLTLQLLGAVVALLALVAIVGILAGLAVIGDGSLHELGSNLDAAQCLARG